MLQQGSLFSNLDDLSKGNIVEVQVDNYDGADPDKLDKEILAELPGKNTPVVPNFLGVFNGLKSEYHVAEQQARYTGAIGAGGLHKLLSFAMEDHLEVVYDNKAYTITAVFDVRGGILSMYAHQLVKPLVPAGYIEYRMTQIGFFFAMDH